VIVRKKIIKNITLIFRDGNDMDHAELSVTHQKIKEVSLRSHTSNIISCFGLRFVKDSRLPVRDVNLVGTEFSRK